MNQWAKRVNAWWLLSKLVDMRYDARVDAEQKIVAEHAIELVISNELGNIQVFA